MKVVFFTTQTPHHIYFLREVSKRFPIDHVVVETRTIVPPFPVQHTYEDEKKRLELSTWFGNKMPSIEEFSKTSFVENINAPEVIERVGSLNCDIGLVFGTGKIRKELIEKVPTFLNLHGGDPEEYRGLDSHLWAIYHQDFGALKTTLHHVAAELDRGDIVSQIPLHLKRGMKLSELSLLNTEACVSLALDALATFVQQGKCAGRAQKTIGRYYSFMPDVLKGVCVRTFERHTEMLT